jgi:hypothetical protein
METKDTKLMDEMKKLPYVSPAIIEKCEITADLQTNTLPDEPPPPL